MVGPTPEGNSMNAGESNLHNAKNISTPSLGDKRNFGRKRTAEALRRREICVQSDFLSQRLGSSAVKS
jgi:hypothetical protein